jgi:hypothetical protein
MYSKSTLRIGGFFFLFSCLFLTSFAQQKRKFIEGLPFTYYQRQANNHPSSRGPYRSYDGTGNNPDSKKSDYGASFIPLFRELQAQFGSADSNNAMSGSSRPSPRQISNSVVDEPVTTFNARGLSAITYVWGQFIDHDMTLTPTDTVEYASIPLPVDEKVFTSPIPFYRSQVYPGSGVSSPRNEINLNTAWIDASMVYGSDSLRARWLRTFKNGKMKTSAGNFLAYNTTSGELADPIDVNAPSMANDGDHTVKTFVAGDVRAAEHPGILSLQTMFVREHNKICDRLVSQGLRNDEQIYQLARKEVGAEIQAITYNEFLPALGITLDDYKGYNPNVRPDILNTFATAGYRVGHSMVADDILLRDNNCREVPPGVLDLVNVFWNPQLVPKYQIDAFLKGLIVHNQYETDTKINSDLRNLLFGDPNKPARFGIDLASLNIQRGRDHGLPDYNTVRKFYTGSAAKNFSDITSDPDLADSLKKLYGTVNNIDLWVGALAEDHVTGSSVGNTIYRILKAQFENVRNGDFYFYLNDPYLPSQTLAKIKMTQLSDVIKRNTSLTNVQSDVFFMSACAEDTVGNGSFVDTTGMNPFPKLFPNPATSVITVDMGPSTKSTGSFSSLVKIFSLSGIQMKSVTIPAGTEFTQIDISRLSAGTYIAYIMTNGNIKILKFIKMGG